jgi:menaquinol-cytochrome c reductase iron-sulfur subunit
VSDATHTPQGETPNGVAEQPMTRGQFLTAATLGVGGVMGALMVVPVAGLALGPVFGGEDFEPVFIGTVDEFKDGSFTKVVLSPHADKPDAYVRKRVAFVRRNTKEQPDRFALEGQEEFTVISNICMHLGCPVTATTSGFVCPCHGGAYDSDGARTGGPPVRPLDRFLWERRGEELWATAVYALTNDGEKATHRDPGQHTSGPESLMYPLQP